MSSRTYLSIGDVLTLLREEFPDVTISKIRFLESQGLVNPERSPSGYRKFFDHDVERLRWVLRQQREHFLPLKVIRDRLADGELDDEPGDRANGKTAEPVGAHVATAASPDDEQPTKADEEAMARIVADASRRTARMPEAAQARRGLQVVTEHSAPDVAQPPIAAASASASGPRHARDAVAAAPAAVDAGVVAAAGADGGGGVQARRDAAPPQDDAASGGRRASEPTTETPARGPAHPPAAATPPAPAPASRPAPPVTPGVAAAAVAATTTSMVTGASLTAQELAAASGLSLDEVEGLEGFGLICSVRVAGMQTYDEEALAVANLAAAFRAFGIEPRHLRLYRNAVDREMGLIEQVVIPLLRQRNPESRQRAAEGADQLAALGQSMRASLLRQALRQHLGG